MALRRPILGSRSAESRIADMAGSSLISEPMLLSIRKLFGSRICKECSRLESRKQNGIYGRRPLSGRGDGAGWHVFGPLPPSARVLRHGCKATKASGEVPSNRIGLCAVNHQGSPLPNDQSALSTNTKLTMMSSGRTDSLLFSSSAMYR
jgi:hypothetical protein